MTKGVSKMIKTPWGQISDDYSQFSFVPTRGVPTVAVGDLVKYIIPDDWEHHAIEAPIFTDEPSLGVVKKINWVMLTTSQGAFYRTEAEVYWSVTGKSTKHTHDDLSLVTR